MTSLENTRESTKNVQHIHLPSALVSRALKAASADALSLSANILTLVSKQKIMRTELIKHINWRITRPMQNPFHMPRYGTKLRSGGCPVQPFVMNEPQDNQTIQNKFHVWEDTETFRNLTKSPLPTHPLVLPQCHRLPSPLPTVRPVNGLSSDAGLIVVVL